MVEITRHNDIFEFKLPEDIKNLIICGDIHGEFRELVFNITKRYEMRDACVIVAGDCGFGFHKYGYYQNLLKFLNNKLIKNNIYVLFVRGNHDSPEYFNSDFFQENRFICIPDYSVVKCAERTVLCIGGAISIDRAERRNNDSDNTDIYHPAMYWKDEAPVFDIHKLETVLNISSPDTIVTHCAPDGVKPYVKTGLESWTEKDREIISDDIEARNVLTSIRDFIFPHCHIKDWFYGHYHYSNSEYIDNTRYRLLGIMEFYQTNYY